MYRVKNVEEIKRRFGDYGLFGYLGFLTKKIAFVWGDGTYYVSDKLSMGRMPKNPESLIVKMLAKDGRYNKKYILCANMVQGVMLLVFLVGGWVTRKSYDRSMILKLTVMGLFVFFLAWEARSRYLVNMIPLFIIMEVYFVEKIRQLAASSRKDWRKHCRLR